MSDQSDDFIIANVIMTKQAETAYIAPEARIAEDVRVGHNSYIGPEVTLGSGCMLYNNVTIIGRTTIGSNNEFFQNAVIGAVPQDLKFKGGDTEVIIGDGNIFRENVTVHLGTELGGGKTVLGSGNLLMAGVHIGHDSKVADQVVIANNALIAGHVALEERTWIGGGAAIHHFVSVGRNAMIGGLSRVVHDIPPFMIFDGNPGSVRGVNTTGLSRNRFTAEQIDAIKHAYKKLFRQGDVLPALDELAETNGDDTHVQYLIDFIRRSFQGRYGRYLESTRVDKPEDLGDYFKTNQNRE